MKLQRLLSLTRQAVDDYQMIDDGDRIAVGISGGKDSLTLLYALHELARFYPKSFQICGISVDLGFGSMDLTGIRRFCDDLAVPFQVVQTNIAGVLFESRKETNPCSLCAKMRKGALNQAALQQNCNKIAYAHHTDDVVETMLLSLIYEGRFHAFSPKTYLDRTELTVIRPLLYVHEADVIGFCNKYQLPVCKNPCPMDGHTRREYAKQLLKQLEQENRGTKDRMFHAIVHGHIEGWLEV